MNVHVNVGGVLEQEILPKVEKASRYLGTEVNAVHKDRALVDVRLALAFPDLYDLGLGNLGLHVLYACVNRLPWAWCERTYAPGRDMEDELRARGLPLFALESKDSLALFDGIGFTLQSELTYTNILNILDMSGIPMRTADRSEHHPLTFAGGPAVYNPEPLAPFMDFFVIGDGEDAIVEIVEVMRATRGLTRAQKLVAMSKLEGVYVPALYPFDTLADGSVLPAVDAPKIRKRITRDLNGATFPTDYIIPYTKLVHDRISLEVLRGCTQGCRFCQAGMVTRPVRERKLEKVDELLRRTLDATGYEEVGLVSLSTCDYSRVRQLVENTVEAVRDEHVSVSLPSLRLDSFSVDLADMVAETRRTGLTFAPEAASPRLRAVINKWIPDEDLLGMAHRAFELKWDHVKLYFMIGLPTERDDDIEAIADLAKRTLAVGRKVNGRASVNLGVSTFVPKPFTPFQWAPQISYDETIRRQDVLEAVLPRQGIKFGRHHPEETFLEGLISRGDRRVGDLLEAAWKRGCRFDAWSEHLDFRAWQRAIADVGFDVAHAIRERDLDERLPWDHLDMLIPKAWFQEDWKRALELKHAEDCRHKRCHKCGVIDKERDLCAAMLRDNVEARKPEAAWTRKPPAAEPAPQRSVQRLWLRIARTGNARFLSHLEVLSAWVRALRRAKVPLAYSQGFHPHAAVAFSSAAPFGEESLGDYLDLDLTRREDVPALIARVRAVLPDGFDVLGGAEVALKAPSLMSVNAGGVFLLRFPDATEEGLAERARAVLASDSIMATRRSKAARAPGLDGTIQVDIRPMIHELVPHPDRVPSMRVVLLDVDGKPGKAGEVTRLLTDRPEVARIVRLDTLQRDGDAFRGIGDSFPR